MKPTLLSIGLICIVVGGACLLAVHYHSKSVSDRAITQNPAVETAVSNSTVAQMVTATSTPAAATSTATSKLAAAVVTSSSSKVTPIHFEVVTTPAAQEQGLGGRAVIPDNYAMLFVFPEDGSVGFWMKDMLTPIDMIWLTDNGTISGIVEDALPSSYPNVFYPPSPTKYVLETRVGLAKEKGWTIGTKIQLPLPYGE
jgi:uncharacterized protein